MYGGLDDAPTGSASPSPDPPALGGVAPMAFVRLSGGEFTMGSPDGEPGRDDDEGPRHRVRLSTYEIAVTEVTQAQYRAVIGTNPSDCRGGCGDDLPVQAVSWNDAVAFLNALSEREGRAPCYKVEGRTVTWADPRCAGYRLPTEAEWEYAARAGTTTAWGFGADPRDLDRHAWTASNAEGRVHPVGALRVNAWGLADVHGNVWEWSWDWYGAFGNLSLSDPSGPDKGDSRVLRGGSFKYTPEDSRSANRSGNWPELRLRYYGFRCVRGVPPSL
jgi:formylglycine-generating enzyme required for sulfatase activity